MAPSLIQGDLWCAFMVCHSYPLIALMLGYRGSLPIAPPLAAKKKKLCVCLLCHVLPGDPNCHELDMPALFEASKSEAREVTNKRDAPCNTSVFKSERGAKTKKIPLPSAAHLKERLTVIQSISLPSQQSVRQKHTVWVFCQWQTRPQAWGELLAHGKQWPNGNVADRRRFGRRFEPLLGEHGSGAADDSRPTRGSNRRHRTLQSAASPFDRCLM